MSEYIRLITKNENEINLTNTLNGIYDNLEAFCSNKISTDDIAVVVMADGILNLEKSILEYFDVLDKDMGYPELTIDSRLKNIQEETEKYIDEAENEREKKERLEEMERQRWIWEKL